MKMSKCRGSKKSNSLILQSLKFNIQANPPSLLNTKNPTIAHDFNDDVFKSFPNMPKIYPH